jgi:hypothetical protein
MLQDVLLGSLVWVVLATMAWKHAVKVYAHPQPALVPEREASRPRKAA